MSMPLDLDCNWQVVSSLFVWSFNLKIYIPCFEFWIPWIFFVNLGDVDVDFILETSNLTINK